jgi:uncharacterized protein YjcR
MIAREVRIAAVADYLIGVRTRDILAKYRINHATILHWIKKSGHFVMRREDIGTKLRRYK